MKQTAVEWLYHELDNILPEMYPSEWDKFKIAVKKAKAMEKEQMIDFTMDYVNSDSIGCLWDGDSAPELDIDTSAEQYYDRTFNTK